MGLEVSVVIPTYNSAAYLPAAIDSALNQTLAPLEVIVVDDGSTDKTQQVLEPYRRRIRYIFQDNKGPAAARNRGIAAAEGDLIAFLDADDTWLPEKLKRQLACLAEHPRAGLVHSNQFYWNELTGEKSLRDEGQSKKIGYCYPDCGLMPSTMLIHKECLVQVGGFDEAIRRATFEDYDLCLRIARRYEFAYVDEPLVLHRLHASNASKNRLAMAEDHLYVFRKAVQVDPGPWPVMGRRAANEGLFSCLFDVGYCHHDMGQPGEARRYFLQALCHRPLSPYTWLLYLTNLLPSSWVRRLKKSKSSLTSAVRNRQPEAQ